MRRLAFALILSVGLVACSLTPTNSAPGSTTGGGASSPFPTIANLEMIATHDFLTANAPPAGFGEVSFAPLDARLSDHPGWTYTIAGSFTGVFDDTGAPASGTFEALVQADSLGERRRVVLRIEGDAFLPEDTLLQLEGVRLSNDYFTVDVNGQCAAGSSVIADLSALQLVGGITKAVPTGHRKEIAGVPAWQYTFTPDAVKLPATTLKLTADSVVQVNADLWIAPQYDAVLLFEATLDVQRVRLLSGERDVSGALYLRYELNVPELDVQPNISIPHGC